LLFAPQPGSAVAQSWRFPDLRLSTMSPKAAGLRRALSPALPAAGAGGQAELVRYDSGRPETTVVSARRHALVETKRPGYHGQPAELSRHENGELSAAKSIRRCAVSRVGNREDAGKG